MKITLKYDETDAEDKKLTLRLTMPAKYVEGPTNDVIKLFIGHYNKKHEDTPLDPDKFHLKIVGGEHLDREERVKDCVKDKDELYVLSGVEMLPAKRAVAPVAVQAATSPAPKANSTGPKKDAEGRVRCKNFGCKNWFFEDDPPECRHHKSAPIFHETAKWWSCCPDKKEYEFEAFEKVPGCVVGRCMATTNTTRRTLGGCDLRADVDSAPHRIDADAPVDPRRKLNALRSGVIAMGVDEKLFEDVGSRLLTQANGDHEAVVRKFSARFSALLNGAK